MVTSHKAKTTLTFWAAVWATKFPEQLMGQLVVEHRREVEMVWRMNRKRAIPVYEGEAEVDMTAAAAWRRRVRPKWECKGRGEKEEGRRAE